MAFITNQKGAGAKKLGERLSELLGHSERLDMLVGFFYFSGVKVLYDALKARADLRLRVLVGMEAEMAMGHLVESLKKEVYKLYGLTEEEIAVIEGRDGVQTNGGANDAAGGGTPALLATGGHARRETLSRRRGGRVDEAAANDDDEELE